jgi:hypothetical protein
MNGAQVLWSMMLDAVDSLDGGMPGLRCVLFVFAGLAAVLYGERHRARLDSTFLVDDDHGRMLCEGNRCTA